MHGILHNVLFISSQVKGELKYSKRVKCLSHKPQLRILFDTFIIDKSSFTKTSHLSLSVTVKH